jgi:hypothetical protein
MYGFLHESLVTTRLRGKSYQGHAILNAKEIIQFENGCVFTALVDEFDTSSNNEYKHFEVCDAELLSNVFFKMPPSRKPLRLRLDITDPIAAKKYRKKYVRRLNNLSLTEQNWRQFIGSRSLATESVIRNLQVTEVSH